MRIRPYLVGWWADPLPQLCNIVKDDGDLEVRWAGRWGTDNAGADARTRGLAARRRINILKRHARAGGHVGVHPLAINCG